MGRLSEYDKQDQDKLRSTRLHSDSLPRVDHDLSTWTTQIKVEEGISLTNILDNKSSGFLTPARKV